MASARKAVNPKLRRANPAALTLLSGLVLGLCACSQRSSAAPGSSIQTIADFFLSETQHRVVQWTLRARQATLHDAGNAELTQPYVEVYENGKPATQVQSKHGIYDETTRNIHMQDDVVAVSHDEDSEGPTTLKTDALDFINAEQKFKTDRPVVVIRKGSIMHGRGLIANHDLSEIHILHQESDLK